MDCNMFSVGLLSSMIMISLHMVSGFRVIANSTGIPAKPFMAIMERSECFISAPCDQGKKNAA
jgi:hypothetical protein